MFIQSIRIVPDPFIPANVIMSRVFSELHFKFLKSDDSFGISFPEYNYNDCAKLGQVLNVVAKSASSLQSLVLKEAFSGFALYAKVGDIYEEKGAVTLFKRFHVKNSVDSHQRRAQKRGSDFNRHEASAVLRYKRRENFKEAFLIYQSISSGDKFCFFVKPFSTVEDISSIVFNKYGLATGENHP